MKPHSSLYSSDSKQREPVCILTMQHQNIYHLNSLVIGFVLEVVDYIL